MAGQVQQLYVYSLPDPLLNSLVLVNFDLNAESSIQQDRPSLTPSSDPPEPFEESPASSEAKGNSCGACQVIFETAEDQREHFKSDIHRFNVRRKVIGLPPVETEEFDRLIDESISGSDEDDDGSDTDNVSALLSKTRLDTIAESEDPELKAVKSPYHIFASPLLPADSVLAIYSCMFPSDPSNVLEQIRSRQKSSGVSAIFMVGGGHFAGAIVSHELTNNRNNPVKTVLHKTFHRYTTRRKQGGSQSANDNANGKASSAGSSLRRYNEAALEKEISELMLEWKPYIDAAEHVFIRASGKMSRHILFKDGIISPKDKRVSVIPFITRRATGKEVKQVWLELTRPKVLKREQFITKVKPKPIAPVTVEKEVIVPKELSAEELHTTQIVALVKKSRTNSLKLYLENNKLSADFRFEPTDQFYHTPTALHLAASLSLSRMVSYLLVTLHADPTLVNDEGRTAWELSGDRPTRDAFRLSRGEMEGVWDWNAARVPAAISKDDIASRDASEKLQEKKERDEAVKRLEATRKSDPKPSTKKTLAAASLSTEQQLLSGLTPEARLKIERERRARAVEARMNAQKNR